MDDVRYPTAGTACAKPVNLFVSASAQFASRISYLPDPGGAVADCNQDLWITVFFDGTGNNERSMRRHLNIAMWRACFVRIMSMTSRQGGFGFTFPASARHSARSAIPAARWQWPSPSVAKSACNGR